MGGMGEEGGWFGVSAHKVYGVADGFVVHDFGAELVIELFAHLPDEGGETGKGDLFVAVFAPFGGIVPVANVAEKREV